MASVNKVIILGNLGRDPEVRYAPSGDAIANIAVATMESWKDKATGEKKTQTEWHRVSFFGKLAEVVGQYLKKGSPVYIEGSLRTRKWQDKDGQERFVTEIRADAMQMLGGQNNDGQKAPAPAPAPRPAPAPKPPPAPAKNQFDDMDDDIPF